MTKVACQPMSEPTASLNDRLRAMPSSLNDACRTMAEALERITELERSLEECLPCMGWSDLSDERLMIEAKMGNGRAPIILRARAALNPKAGS